MHIVSLLVALHAEIMMTGYRKKMCMAVDPKQLNNPITSRKLLLALGWPTIVRREALEGL